MNAFRVTATDRTEIVADYIFSAMAAAIAVCQRYGE